MSEAAAIKRAVAGRLEFARMAYVVADADRDQRACPGYIVTVRGPGLRLSLCIEHADDLYPVKLALAKIERAIAHPPHKEEQ